MGSRFQVVTDNCQRLSYAAWGQPNPVPGARAYSPLCLAQRFPFANRILFQVTQVDRDVRDRGSSVVCTANDQASQTRNASHLASVQLVLISAEKSAHQTVLLTGSPISFADRLTGSPINCCSTDCRGSASAWTSSCKRALAHCFLK